MKLDVMGAGVCGPRLWLARMAELLKTTRRTLLCFELLPLLRRIYREHNSARPLPRGLPLRPFQLRFFPAMVASKNALTHT